MYSADAPMYSAETIQLYERRAATFTALAAAADKLIEPFLHMTLAETYESANFYRYHRVVRVCDKLKAQAKRMNRLVLAMKRSNEKYDAWRKRTDPFGEWREAGFSSRSEYRDYVDRSDNA